MFALENFTRNDAVSALLIAFNCCCSPVGQNDLRLACADGIDTSPTATLAGCVKRFFGSRHICTHGQFTKTGLG